MVLIREILNKPIESPRSKISFDLEHPVERGGVLTALTLLGLLAGLLGRFTNLAPLEWGGYGLAFIAGGIPAARAAIHSLFKKRKLDVDLLMVVAALGAASVGAPKDGAILLFLFSLSNTLQDWAMDRTSSAIHALMKLHPATATIQSSDGIEQTVALEALRAGDVLIVRPGERFAADGVILSGSSTVDESAITGESVPVDKNVSDDVKSGTLSDAGALTARVTRPAGESTLAKLIALVEQAQSAKSPTEQFAERLKGPYTIAVLLSIPVVFVIARYGFQLEVVSLDDVPRGRQPVRGRHQHPSRHALGDGGWRTSRRAVQERRGARGALQSPHFGIRQNRHADRRQNAPCQHGSLGGSGSR